MTARDRTISSSYIGSRVHSSGPADYRTVKELTNRCEDVVAVGDGYSLQVTKWKSGSALCNGKVGSWTLTSYPLERSNWDNEPPFLSLSGRPTNAQLAAQLLAQTNPSRPVVDIPVFIGELADLPDLVRKAGGGLLREIAAGNLKYQFGIRPLVSDLTSMLNFTDISNRRFLELKALQKSGLRRKRPLWDGSATDSQVVGTNSQPFWLSTDHRRTVITTSKVWGFVKWFPSGNFPTTDAAMLKLARRAVLGLTLDGSTAWELIPFSWLADWFGNVGDLLKANRNIVSASHSTPLIMETVKTVGSYAEVFSDQPAVTPKSFEMSRVSKLRSPTSASLSAQLPMLSLRQLSILGSLAVLRSGRYH